ncbi:MAG: PfkB family carbohydrate kinase [Myxococcota bacterium]
MSAKQPVLVVGSVAFDTLHNHLGKHDRVLGGAATFASLAASFFTDVRLVGVVGQDFPDDAITMFRERGIDLEGLTTAEGLTMHWEGRYTDDLTSRTTLKTELNVFADFMPEIPEAYRDTPYVMLGNIAPALQLKVLDQVRKPKLVVADTMNFWIDGARDDLLKLMPRVDVLVINDEEARQLSGRHHLVHVASDLLEMGPKSLVIKQGEYGAWLFAGEEMFSAPAFPMAAVDPTGAGDSFAGGFLGYLAGRDAVDPASLKAAVIHGSTMASRCVAGIGVAELLSLAPGDIEERVATFRRLVDFPAA